MTQWDGADITALGMLKLDVLAIKNLDMVKRAVAADRGPHRRTRSTRRTCPPTRATRG